MTAVRTRVAIDAAPPSNTRDIGRTVRVTTYPTRSELIVVGIGDGDPEGRSQIAAVLDADQAQRLADVLNAAAAAARGVIA
jgi:hypothetical protein